MFRPIKIRQYVNYMAVRGHAPAAVLEGSGIPVDQLTSPSYLVEFTQYQTVVKNLIRLTGNQAIGFDIGRASELTDLGIVGHAMMSAKTARQALELWIGFSNSLVGMMSSLRLDEEPRGGWSLTITDKLPMGFTYNFAVEEILMIATRLGEALTKEPFMPTSLELSYPAPSHHDLYEKYLGCRPHFNNRRSRVVFSAPQLDVRVRGYDEEFNAICLQHCKQIMRQITSDSPVASRVRSLLLAKAHGIPHVDELAAELNMSSRTLRRHLQEEGMTYKGLVHTLRLDLAQQYLKISRLTVKETAFLLGFKDVNAFRRAFKVWTGHTIHEYLDELDT